MIELYLIRHGKTYGNTLGRYIGTTDESLCREGLEALEHISYPQVEAVYASPMKRCLETAEAIWPGMEPKCCELLKECDFGDFENRNYQELNGNPDYQAWVDSGGTLPFPGGESHETFKARCREGFLEVLRQVKGTGLKCVGLVVHGGTIMSILEAYAEPHEEFYHWQVKNGCGYRVLLDENDEGGIRLYEASYLGPDSGLSAGSDIR